MLVEQVDFFRVDANRRLNPERRSELGQYMTPPATARLMASMFEAQCDSLRLLDAGAGVGSLTAAFVDEMCQRERTPKTIQSTAYEIDHGLAEYLSCTLEQCRTTAGKSGVAFTAELVERDFIEPGGEIVAITPRSFCNGPYFKPFRKLLLETMKLRRIHVFESRQVAFKEDEVLQENIIFHAVKSDAAKNVVISSSSGPDDEFATSREIAYEQLVRPEDKDYFIHIVPDELGASIAEQIGRLHWTLNEHDLAVSTGRVVDFRATPLLRDSPADDTVPLIYPRNLQKGFVEWPIPGGKKAQALAQCTAAEELLVRKGVYVLVKRFSAKEESRRVVAAVYDPTRVNADHVGFENHLNYFHRNGGGLSLKLAKGLAAFLNSTLVDLYFRQFNGHTQVNATDLRSLRYPTRSQLEAIGSRVGGEFPQQELLDLYVEEALNLPEAKGVPAPVKAKKKIDEALDVLKHLGLPRGHDGFLQSALWQRICSEHSRDRVSPNHSSILGRRNCADKP